MELSGLAPSGSNQLQLQHLPLLSKSGKKASGKDVAPTKGKGKRKVGEQDTTPSTTVAVAGGLARRHVQVLQVPELGQVARHLRARVRPGRVLQVPRHQDRRRLLALQYNWAGCEDKKLSRSNRVCLMRPTTTPFST